MVCGHSMESVHDKLHRASWFTIYVQAVWQADKLLFSDTALKMQLVMTGFVHPVNTKTAVL